MGLWYVLEIELRMLVIGITELKLECFKTGNRFLDQCIDVVAGLALVDLGAFQRRNAIAVAHAADRRTDMPPVADIRRADANAVLACVRVRQRAAALAGVVQHALAGDLVVAGIARVGVQVQADRTGGAIDRQRTIF